jgi:hypothetical protein
MGPISKFINDDHLSDPLGSWYTTACRARGGAVLDTRSDWLGWETFTMAKDTKIALSSPPVYSRHCRRRHENAVRRDIPTSTAPRLVHSLRSPASLSFRFIFRCIFILFYFYSFLLYIVI